MSHVIALVDDDRNILTSVSISLQSEGFVTRVYTDGASALKAFADNMPDLGVFERLFPEIQALIGCEQEPEWHPEGDVWIHTLMVVDQARALNADLDRPRLITVMLAAICHDLGKPATTAYIDGRFLPGYEDEFFTTLAELVGEGIDVDYLSNQRPWEMPYEGRLVDAMTRSLLAEDPDALVAPYLMSGGTDAKWFAELGIRGFGFTPLRLPEELDFTALFHGVDERVPVDSLTFGARVFDGFLDRVSGR